MLDCTDFSRVVSFVFFPQNIDVIGYEMKLNKGFQTYMYLLFHLGSWNVMLLSYLYKLLVNVFLKIKSDN